MQEITQELIDSVTEECLRSKTFKKFGSKCDPDAFREAALKGCWEGAKKWRKGSGASLETFCKHIALKRCLDVARTLDYVKVLPTVTNCEEIDIEDKSCSGDDLKVFKEYAAGKLNRLQAKCFYFCCMKGMKQEELGNLIGIKVEEIDSNIVEARRLLMEVI